MWFRAVGSAGALINKYSFLSSCILQGDEDGSLQVRKDSVEAYIDPRCLVGAAGRVVHGKCIMSSWSQYEELKVCGAGWSSASGFPVPLKSSDVVSLQVQKGSR